MSYCSLYRGLSLNSKDGQDKLDASREFKRFDSNSKLRSRIQFRSGFYFPFLIDSRDFANKADGSSRLAVKGIQDKYLVTVNWPPEKDSASLSPHFNISGVDLLSFNKDFACHVTNQMMKRKVKPAGQ